MRKRITRILKAIATIGGIFAGFVGGVHGYYEITHGNSFPNGLFYDAVSGKALAVDNPHWAGWPAMTIVPNFIATGVITLIIAVIVITWTVLRVNQTYGGLILITLSVIMCLFGGGFVPPLIGVVAGTIGMVGKTCGNQKRSPA